MKIKNNVKTHHLVFLMFLLLTGCAAKTAVQLHTPEQINAQDMPLLKVVTNEFTAKGFDSYIFTVRNSKNEEIVKPHILEEYFTELYLPEGDYLMELLCDNGFGSAMPMLPISIAKSKVYHLTCEADKKEKRWLSKEKDVTSLKVNIQEVEH